MAKKNKQPIQSDEPIYMSPESIKPVVVNAYNVASPRAIPFNELIDLAKRDLDYKRSTWTDNPLKPVFISTNPKAYYQNPENVYQNILMDTGDIYAAIEARRKARLENRNIENNLHNWTLAQQHAIEDRKPTIGITDPALNALGLAPLITAAPLVAPLIPTSFADIAAITGSYLLGNAVDKAVKETTDYDTFGDAVYYGLGGDDPDSILHIGANMLNPGYWIGGGVGANSKNILKWINRYQPHTSTVLYSGIPITPGNSNSPSLWSRIRSWIKPNVSTGSSTQSTATATNASTARSTSAIDQTKNYSMLTPYALRKRGVNLSPSFKWNRREIRSLERNNPDALDVIALEARDVNNVRPLSPAEFDKRLPAAVKRAGKHNEKMLKLRNKAGYRSVSNDLLEYDKALSYRDPNVTRGSWITHPVSNVISGAPALWRQNHPVLSLGEATVFNPWYGIPSYPVRTYGPEVLKYWYRGPENDQVTEKPESIQKAEPQQEENYVSLKEQFERSKNIQ